MIETDVLVVEDDPDIRKQMVRAMRRTVRNVDEADNGVAAIELFHQKHHPLVVLDLRLPRMDGMEVFRQLRKADARSQVIVVTGHGSKDDAVAAINLQVYRFFEKPASLDDLEDALTRAYNEYLARTQSSALSYAAHSDLEERTRLLYQKLEALTELSLNDPNNKELQVSYLSAMNELRDVQAIEADLMVREFREKLPLANGEGLSALEQAREELRRGSKGPA